MHYVMVAIRNLHDILRREKNAIRFPMKKRRRAGHGIIEQAIHSFACVLLSN